MEPVIWDGFVCDLFDLSEFLRGAKKWENVRKKQVKFLVDTGASISVLPRELIEGIKVIDQGITKAQGICKEPIPARKILVGIAILVDGIQASNHEVLVLADQIAEKKLLDILRRIGASALLGRLSLDSLNLIIDPKTRKPMKIPLYVL